jgi:HEAT repeat protein
MRRAAILVLLGAGCGGPPAPAGPRAAPADPVISSNPELPVGTPYSRWEHFEHLHLLQSNGFAEARSSWRAAASNAAPSIRAAACALLAEAPIAEDRPALLAAAKDPDSLVQVWSILALIELGDRDRTQALHTLANAPVTETDRAPLIAAVALLRLGDVSAVPRLASAMNDDDLRLEATRRLHEIWRLDPGAALPLFSRALRDQSPVVRSLALAQLEELRTASTRSILDEFVQSSADPLERARAQKLLASLTP